MNNILLDPLPTEYNGYKVNTSFRIGIQISLLNDETDITQREKLQILHELLFGEADGTTREAPENLEGVVKWFMQGWFHDNEVKEEENHKRMLDYDVDQFRIYADFLQIYGIDLNKVDLHFWAFQGLLWNMPAEKSSFMQCLEIRNKKPSKHATPEERKAIERAHKRFDLPDINKPTEYTSEQKAKIDDFDEMMKKLRG